MKKINEKEDLKIDTNKSDFVYIYNEEKED